MERCTEGRPEAHAEERTGERPDEPTWKVLIVDDDPEVHDVTRMILSKIRYRDRNLSMISAYSAAEACLLLAGHGDIAIILLDVVMERDDAGLELVRHIRNVLRNDAVRIILRTGQPGQAPEEQVIVEYDINDYKAKTELTARKLFTTVIAALRSHRHIIALDANRKGLERILASAGTLFRIHSMHEFATGVLTQLSAFLGCAPNGILCVQNPEIPGDAMHILAGVGQYEGCPTCRLVAGCTQWRFGDLLGQAMRTRSHVHDAEHTVLFIAASEKEGTAVLVHAHIPPSEFDRKLLELFAAKISIGFQNVVLYEHLEDLVAERTRDLALANQELERLATTDPLTGARNRRSFMAHAEIAAAGAARGEHSLSILAIDLDHFKSINDRHGHAAGDEALKAFVRCAESCLRPEDIIGRLGGEEFAVIVSGTSPVNAYGIAERLRAAVAGMAVTVEGCDIRLTVSIGVAQSGPDGVRPEDILRTADKRLYTAKSSGRNRVVATEATLAGMAPGAGVTAGTAVAELAES